MVYSIQEVLYLLESIGVFEFMLPFLLIFAVVFGILTSMGIFGKNKGINVIIAFVIGLIAVRFPFFTQFYQELFPRLGIGITILLTLLILVGLFFTQFNTRIFILIATIVGIVIGIIVLYQTFAYLGWTFAYADLGANAVGWIIAAVIFIGIIVAIVASTSSKPVDDKTLGLHLPISAFSGQSR